jgi:hypothetical protein
MSSSSHAILREEIVTLLNDGAEEFQRGEAQSSLHEDSTLVDKLALSVRNIPRGNPAQVDSKCESMTRFRQWANPFSIWKMP